MYTVQVGLILRIASIWEKGSHTLDYLLDRELKRSKIDSTARSAVTEWIYGWGRSRGSARYLLDASLDRGLDSLDPKLRLHLEMIASRLLIEERTPKPIVVSRAVDYIKQLHGSNLGKLSNAVLRKIADRPPPWPNPDVDPVHHLAVSRSHPDWIVARWLDRWGFDKTRDQLDWDNTRPQLWLRNNPLRQSTDEAVSQLEAAGVEFEISQEFSGFFRLKSSFHPAAEALVSSGLFTVQDPSASLAVHLLAPKSGMSILDLCAAPGGKTTLIAELIGDSGQILAVDVSVDRLNKLDLASSKLGLTSIQTQVADGRDIENNPDLYDRVGTFDAVLVDIPCSGTGVMNRRADLRWRRTPEDFSDLTELQRALLRSGAAATRPGGTLVYSTCSIEPEENEEIVHDFLRDHPEFKADAGSRDIPETFLTNVGELNSFSPRDGIDGIYSARMIKKL
jgi:16S rRNA (cytosine967-C5)-methyltransferase